MEPWKYLLAFFVLLVVTIWFAVFISPDNYFHIIACDVGQGDGILITYKNIQILTDGGIPDGKVLKCLSRHMPFYDREIELVVLTHPQLDHYGGLIEVFKRYKVDNFFVNALESSNPTYQVLKSVVGGKKVRVVNPTAGQKLRVGLIHLDIFWPSADFLTSEGYSFDNPGLGKFSSKRDPNDFSVQDVVSFGNFTGLLTGDIGHNMADSVLEQFNSFPVRESIQYIKIPHHGSKYGLTPDYLNIIEPKFAVISVGKNNRYGHPHKETLEVLKEKGIKTLRTDEKGDIEAVSDGKRWWVR